MLLRGSARTQSLTMIIHQRLLIPILFSWVLDLQVGAQKDVYFWDPRIVYAGVWYRPNGSDHMFTSDPKATATFNFTGGYIHSI